MKISIKGLSEYVARETNLPEESVEQAIRAIRSGIDLTVAREHIEGIVKTLAGISMPNLTNIALIELAIGNDLDRTKAQRIVQSLQGYIVQNLNKGYEVEIEALGTYRNSSAKKLDINSQLEFEPLPFPDIPGSKDTTKKMDEDLDSLVSELQNEIWCEGSGWYSEGIAYTLDRINFTFKKNYEEDIDKIIEHYERPVLKTKNRG